MAKSSNLAFKASFATPSVDIHYPESQKIWLIMDNLNTHSIGSLYDAFDPTEALRIAKKLEIHYTPKNGSWLNMAEIELGIRSRQRLERRIPNQESYEERDSTLGKLPQ